MSRFGVPHWHEPDVPLPLGYRRDASVDARELQALNEAAETLRLYADEDNWTQPTPWGGRIFDDEAPAILDSGARARDALARLDAVRAELGGTK